MKRFACVLALLALAAPAHASGIALRWGSCEGFANRNFACDRSTGSELLVGSFSPPGGITALSGIEVVLRISSADGTVPSWWQAYGRGNCRQGSLAASFEMSDQTECDDPWSGQATGGIARYQADGSNGVDMWMVAAVPRAAAQPAASGRTFAAFKLLLNHQRSGGAGSCTGCDVPMCIKLEAIRLVQDRAPDAHGATTPRYDVLTDGINGMGGSSQVATWQGGTSNCSAGTSKPSTWGQLKDRFKPH